MAEPLPPEMQEAIRAMASELGTQFAFFKPILQAIGWAVLAYFIILIIVALLRARREHKKLRIMQNIEAKLEDIIERLPEKKVKKEKKNTVLEEED